MKVLRLVATLAITVLLMAACSKSGSNNNAPANANKPANTNAAASSSAPAGTKGAVKPVSTTPSGENVYTHEEGGIQFEAPPTWSAEGEGDTITLKAPDNSVAVVFTVVEQANLENAANAIDAELEKVMQNVEAKGEVEKDTYNGMTVFSQDGTGEIGGNQILWGTALLMAKKPVLVYSFAAPGLWEKHQDDIRKLIESVKPVS
jgi:hypothetical protein